MKKFVKHTYNNVGRQYLFDDDSLYYSVTTMLGHTKDQIQLNAWRNRVGKSKAEAITKTACNIGTDMHAVLEQYLLGNELIYPNAVVKMLCRQIIPYIDKRIKHVYSTEKVLYSDKLCLAGTVDGVVDYLIGNLTYYSILDFKTSNRVPKIMWIRDYFEQMCLYSMMLSEMTGTFPAGKGVLLFAFKKQRSNKNEVVVNLDAHVENVKKRVKAFHKIIQTF